MAKGVAGSYDMLVGMGKEFGHNEDRGPCTASSWNSFLNEKHCGMSLQATIVDVSARNELQNYKSIAPCNL